MSCAAPHSADAIMEASIRQLVAPLLQGLEPSPDIGAAPRLEWIPKDWILIDPSYQRSSENAKSRALIRKIVEHFSWAKFAPISVAEVKEGEFAGYWACIDGQHRAIAALCHPLVKEVPCWIVDAPDARTQAKAFVSINKDRAGITALQLHRAQLAAGDPDALMVERVCRAAGVTIAYYLTDNQLPPKTTQAVVAIRRLIAANGEAPVKAALMTLAAAYAEVSGQLRGVVIQSVCLLFKKHGKRIDPDRLVRVLRERDCEKLIEAARDVKALLNCSTQEGMATAIERAYDKGLPADRRLNQAT